MLRRELLPGVLILIIVLVKLAADLLAFNYNWDIDHMMYSGGRLLAGELHWTVEFDDKLPVVQVIFALPAIAHSIQVWQIMSALCIFAGCVSTYLFLVALIRDYFPEVRTRAAKTIAFYCAVLIAYSFALLPSGITHINPMAASLAIMSIAFADAARRQFLSSRARCYGAFLLGAFCASVAIGIRPYFLYPLVFTGLWSALKVDWRSAVIGRPPTSNRYRTSAKVLLWAIGWIMAVGFFGLVANALPYVVVGRLDVLLAGLEMLSQKLNPEGMNSILRRQFYHALWKRTGVLFVLGFVLWGVAIIRLPFSVPRTESGRANYRAALDIGYLVILCPLLLEIAILTKHFWSHYIQMFVPFIWIGAGLLIANLLGKSGLYFARVKQLPLVIVCVIVIIASSWGAMKKPLRVFRKPFSRQHSQAKELAQFQKFLATRPESNRDFLNPSGMYFHWQLGEPRHGFPHAANTRHIVSKGWWENVKVPEPFDLPTDREAYCSMLETKGPSLVVELKETDVTDCLLKNADSKYSLVKDIPSTSGLIIFERHGDRE